MDNHIAAVCRFCLGGNEEFNHLANDCPALWFERHTTNAQDPDHSTPEAWTPTQILDFTFFPRINEAFVKPLFIAEGNRAATLPIQDDINITDPGNPDTPMSDSEASVMEVSSLEDSSSAGDDNSEDSMISVI